MKKVYKFKCDIYPPTVFITDETDIEVLKSKYIFCDLNTLTQENSNASNILHDSMETSIIIGMPVMEKRTNSLGIILIINDIDSVNIEEIAHEAVHVADYIYQFIGGYSQDFKDGNECYAYLVGWAASRINEVIENIKSNKNDTRRI